MVTVALIGGDGSGKSSISERLVQQSDMPIKRIYMGANLESASHLLPWSRLILKLKLIGIKRQAGAAGTSRPADLTTHGIAQRQKKTGAARVAARSAYRFIEYAHRIGLARRYERDGYHVVFDRHFLFDVAVDPNSTERSLATHMKRANHWLLCRLLPRPDVFIYLDADPEVMMTRKQEVPAEYLRHQRAMWLSLGSHFDNFVRIDANRGLDEVYGDVTAVIREVSERRR